MNKIKEIADDEKMYTVWNQFCFHSDLNFFISLLWSVVIFMILHSDIEQSSGYQTEMMYCWCALSNIFVCLFVR